MNLSDRPHDRYSRPLSAKDKVLFPFAWDRLAVGIVQAEPDYGAVPGFVTLVSEDAKERARVQARNCFKVSDD